MKKKFLYLIFIILIVFNACDLNLLPDNKFPSIPILKYPSNNAINIKLDTILYWIACTDDDGNLLKYDVFLGKENPPLKKIVYFLNDTSYFPVLQPNTTYYWRVVVNDGKGGMMKSDIWSFTTIPIDYTAINHNPSSPILISPIDKTTNIPLKILLEWSASTDEDDHILKYIVLFGTDFPPNVTLTSIQTTSTFTPILRKNTKYFWQIITTDGNGGINQSEIRSFTTVKNINSNPPKVPNLLSPLNNSVNIPLNQIMNWNKSLDPDGDVVKYNVLFSTNNPPSSIISTLQPDTFLIPQLISNTIYYWKIIAIDANDIISESEIRTFKTINDALTTITLFSPPNNQTKIKLNEILKWNEWKTTSGGNVKYTVYFDTESNPVTHVSIDQSVTTFSPTLNPNTIYYWKVTANDGVGNTSESEIWKFTTVSNPPPKPILISPSNNASNISLSQIMKWEKVIDGNNIIKYNVLLGTASPPTKILSTLQTLDTFTPSLSGNMTYFWQIVADNGNGGISESDIWNFSTLNNAPSKPNLISPKNQATDINIDDTLKWDISTDPDGDIVNYNVFLGTTNPPAIKVSTLQTVNYYTFYSLLPNTIYYWKIVANDGYGGESTSEINNFKTIEPPEVPILISPINNATNINLNTNLTWNISKSNNGVVKYNVFLDTIQSPAVKVSDMQFGTSYYATSLLSNKNYYWKIVAVDENGLTSESELRTFKTLLVPPSVPILISPKNDKIIISLSTNLTWNACTSSSGYTVEYDVFLDTLNPLINKEVSLHKLTTYNIPTLKGNKKYYWKIIANDGNGGISESEVGSFTVFEFGLVNVEGGTFTIGCTSEQGSDCHNYGKPPHLVKLSSFSISKYEITQFQWLSIMGSNPSTFTNCNNCPVEYVSWDDIQIFLTTLNNKTGKNYRLPTEAEWEYAARGGNKSKGYKNSGSNNLNDVAWYGDQYDKTHAVGGKLQNELGLYDMSGNVWEWCSDWFGSYNSGSETNPTGPSTGSTKVLRGCSWFTSGEYCVVSFRNTRSTDSRYRIIGFRLVLP